MRKKSGIGKKIVVIALIGIGLSVGTAYAESNLQTIYHVYVDDKPVGVVDNKEVVQSYVDQRKDKAEGANKDLDVEIGEDISFVPEKVFTPEYDNKEVVHSLKQNLSVSVDAVGLSVSGEDVAFLPSRRQADEVVEQLKEKYVEPKSLDKVEARTSAAQEPSLASDDSTITDVTLTEQISKKEEEVEPSSVSTVEEAMAQLESGKSEATTHTIDKGEGLEDVSAQYDLSKDRLTQMNPELKDEGSLKTGQKVKVEKVVPLTEVVVREEGIHTETVAYETKIQKTDDLYKGEEKVKQQGKQGEKEVQFYKERKNGELIEEGTIKEETISNPVEKIVLKGTKEIPSRGTGDFVWPAAGGTITSYQGKRWGRYHKGIDIAGVSDRTIKAADNGVVITAERQSGFGNKIVIDHKNGYKTIYAHLASIDVAVGETVQKGGPIGVMGTTGHSTGIHLHFEIHKQGSLENPTSYF